MIDKKRTACFTGHRNIPPEQLPLIKNRLDNIIERLYRHGIHGRIRRRTGAGNHKSL